MSIAMDLLEHRKKMRIAIPNTLSLSSILDYCLLTRSFIESNGFGKYIIGSS
jgi:hypothetical protein